MIVVRYQPAVHFELLGSWYRARGIAESAGDPTCKPEIGFVVDGIAMGFLFRTDSTVGYFDAFAADPAAPKEARARALRCLIETLTAEAEHQHLHVIMAFTGAPTIVAMMTDAGFHAQPAFTYLVKRIGKDGHHA